MLGEAVSGTIKCLIFNSSTAGAIFPAVCWAKLKIALTPIIFFQ